MSAAADTGRRGHPLCASRMMSLETSVKMLGSQPLLAEAIGIDDRSLRDKLVGKRGVSNADLIATAAALDARASRIAGHAIKLRRLAGIPESAPATGDNQ